MFMVSPSRQNLPYSETSQREAQEVPPAFLFGLLHHLYHLLPEQDEAVVDDFVVVVMSEQPVVELGSFFDFLQEVGQVVVNIAAISQYVHNAAGGTVGDYIVHLILNTLQTALGFLIFRLAGKLLLTPGSVVDPEAGTHSAKGPVLCPHTRFAGQKNNLYNGKG